MDKIKVGYEVGTGKEVSVPINHLCITGQTQVAGKTTTLEAMVARSGMAAIAFVTKRFESGFQAGHRLPPYFRERTDWQFVASVLEATLRERMKFQRSWIMKLCEQRKDWRAPRSLRDVLNNVEVALATAKGINESVYTELRSYLRIVVPQIDHANFAASIAMLNGLNVMDLSEFSSEMQALIIQSALDWIYHRKSNTITVIPEAWEFIPQKRNSPVKIAAVELIRKGAAGKNFVWLDSQDIAGVDKELLRSCVVWLLGVQRERNEVKRTLAQIPFGSPKPTVEDIMGLGLGQFFVCHGRTMQKVYVQPATMKDDTARSVAMGETPVGAAWAHTFPKSAERAIRTMRELELEDETMWKEKYEALKKEFDKLKEEKDFMLRKPVSGLSGGSCIERDPPKPKKDMPSKVPDEDDLYERIVKKLLQDPRLALTIRKPEMEVTIERPKIYVDDTTCRGRIASLIAEGFFEEPKNGNTVYRELTDRRRYRVAKPTVYHECDLLADMGFLVFEDNGYKHTGLNVYTHESKPT